MSDTEAYSETDFLDRAKKLRATAAELGDQQVMAALISSAEAYEQMATWLWEFDHRRPANASERPKKQLPMH